MMKVSIIIPVYNTMPFLRDCIKSVLAQTFRDYELVVVDDGSTDESLDEVKRLTNKLSNVTIISQENSGVSIARNTGIENAKGDYITFVDSDDTIDNDYLETLIKENDTDYLISGIRFVSDGQSISSSTPQRIRWDTEELRKAGASFYDYTTSPVAKLYKRDIVEKYNVRFNPSMSYAEDRDFNIEYIRHITSAKSISYVGYQYNVDVNGSLTKQEHPRQFEYDLLYWNKLYSVIGDVNSPYLSHRLFFFIVDNFSLIAQKKGIGVAIAKFYSLRKIINNEYLKRNLYILDAPRWQKLLLKIVL